MLLRPHLQLLRTRLIWVAALTVALVLMEFFIAAADHLTLRIFWDQVCTCPIDPADTRILLDISIHFAFIGGFLGYMYGNGNVAQSPGLAGALRFTLTRPDSRLNLILAPFLIAATAIVLLPELVWGLLLGWLYLVHAPAFGHLILILESLPAASHLGPHPTFLDLGRPRHLRLSQLQPLAAPKSFHHGKGRRSPQLHLCLCIVFRAPI